MMIPILVPSLLYYNNYTSVNGLIPKMTSNTSPSGIVTSFGSLPDQAYLAMTGKNSDVYATEDADIDIQYQFPLSQSHVATSMQFYGVSGSGYASQYTVTLFGSNDDMTYESLFNTSSININLNELNTYNFNNSASYNYYILTLYPESGNPALSSFQIFGM